MEVFARLDDLEREFVQRQQDTVREHVAGNRRPPRSAREQAGIVRDLTAVCDHDVNNLLFLAEAWATERSRGSSTPDEHRYDAVRLWLLQTAGNLIGLIRPGDESYQPDIASEGRRLGWWR